MGRGIPSPSLGTDDEPWQAQLEAFGSFLRAQRRLANLSLRDMAKRTNLSNAYLSQIERGLHAPSVRVLRSVARALDMSAEAMLAQAGLLDDDPERGPEANPPAGGPTATEIAIRNDPRLSEDQREALLTVYRSYIAASGA